MPIKNQKTALISLAAAMLLGGIVVGEGWSLSPLRLVLFGNSMILLLLATTYEKILSRPVSYSALWNAAPSAAPKSIERTYGMWLLGILVLATVLRSIGLNSDLWMDEVFTITESIRPPFTEIITSYSSDNQHTLYSIMAKLSVSLFGEHAWSLRLPAMLCGVASIWAVARVGRLIFGTREALLAALLCAVSYHHIWFSQNARGYTILLLTTLLATDFFLRGLASERARYWVGYAVAIAAGSYAHLTGVFVAVAHFLLLLILVVRDRGVGEGHLRSFGAIALSGWLTVNLYAPTIPTLIEFFSQQSVAAASTSIYWKDPAWLLMEVARSLGLTHNIGWLTLILAVAVASYAVILFVRRDWVVAFAAFLPAVVLTIVMLSMDRNLWPRMFFHELGFFAIYVVTAFVAVGDFIAARIRSKTGSFCRVAAVAGVLLLVAASSLMLPRLYEHPKQDYQGARDFVLEKAAANDAIVGLHMAGRVYQSYYAPDWPVATTVSEIRELESESSSTWLIYTLPAFVEEAMPELSALLRTEYELVQVFPGSLNDGELVVVRKKMGIAE